jgi:hypothetical protein
VTKNHSLFDFIPLIHREINDPTELERVLLNQSQLRSNPCPHQSSKLRGSRRLVASKKHPIVRPKPHLGHQLRNTLRSEILGDPATLTTLEIDAGDGAADLIQVTAPGGLTQAGSTTINIGITYDTTTEKVELALKILEEIYKKHPKTQDVWLSFNKFEAQKAKSTAKKKPVAAKHHQKGYFQP